MSASAGAARLAIFGHPASQPFRSVSWLCLWKHIPYEFVKIQPGPDTRKPEFKDKFLGATVPALVDRETGVELFEMNAIMVYICREFGLDDVLPREPAVEAKVHQWLHWHHNNTRMFTKSLFAPLVRPDLGLKVKLSPAADKQLANICGVMEKQFTTTPYLVGNTPTLADLCCYEELGQCVHLNLYDFGAFPKVQDWMRRMEALEGFDQVHTKVFKGLGAYIDKVKADLKAQKKAAL
jgi:glutathione S-transferase